MQVKNNALIAIVESSMADLDFVDNKIIEFNAQQVPFTQQEPFIQLSYVIKDNDGIIVSGINASLYCWKILYVSMLWVDLRYRNYGYGSRLLKKVEDEALKMGCGLAHLDTFDFQAKDFYLKHGYEIFGTLEDCPPGHTKYFMKKKL